MVWQLRLQKKSMIKSRSNIGWMMTVHLYQADLVLRLLTIEMRFGITMDCSHLRYLPKKSSLNKDIFFLVKVVLDEITSDKIYFWTPPTICDNHYNKKQSKTSISPITKTGRKRKYPWKLRGKIQNKTIIMYKKQEKTIRKKISAPMLKKPPAQGYKKSFSLSCGWSILADLFFI